MSESLDDTKTRIESFIAENFPSADTAPGSVLSELIVKVASVVQNSLTNSVADLSQVNSVQQALASTTDTYSPIMDEVASNFNTSRFAGKKSTGNIKITVSANSFYLVQKGTQFIQSGLNLTYQTTSDIRVSSNPNLANNEQQLFKSGNLYYFIIPVEAVEVGSQYQVSSRAQFTLGSATTIGFFVSAEAYGNFSTGLPQDTDKQLIEKFQTSISNKSLVSPVAIAARLSTDFPNFRSLSVCGANDPEQTRSKQNLFGIATFGMADVYVRTTLGPEVVTFPKTGTKVSTGLWSVNIGPDDAPGFYRIVALLPTPTSGVVQELGGSLTINSTTYDYQQSPNTRNNVIPAASFARFTKYQTATVLFQYNEPTPVAVGDTASFDVTVSYQPNIADIQNLILSDKYRLSSADYLVKAALPCFVSLNLQLVKKSSVDTIDSLGLNNLKSDIFNYINTIPFGEDLYASKIVNLCHKYDIKSVVLPITLNGQIYGNDGSTTAISDTDVLSIEPDIARGISKNTVQFFTDYYRLTGTDNVSVADNIGIELI